MNLPRRGLSRNRAADFGRRWARLSLLSPVRCLLLAGILGALVNTPLLAADTNPGQQLQRFAAQAGAAGNAARGQQFFNQKNGRDISCSSCHRDNPMQAGQHLSTRKTLAPMAPAANPLAFTDSAKVDKWFRRNCNDVIGRECSAQEKADVLAYLIALK